MGHPDRLNLPNGPPPGWRRAVGVTPFWSSVPWPPCSWRAARSGPAALVVAGSSAQAAGDTYDLPAGVQTLKVNNVIDLHAQLGEITVHNG